MPRPKRYNLSGPLKGGNMDRYWADTSDMFFRTESEVRREYSRLQREANRRIEVLSRSGYSNIKSIKNRKGGYQALSEMSPETNVREALQDVAYFLNLKTSSLKGARAATEKALAKLQDQKGFEFVNERNITEFQEFMGEVQKHKEAKGYDSEQQAEAYKIAKEKRIDPATLAEDFEHWHDHIDDLKKAKRSNSYITASEFAALRDIDLTERKA